MPPAVAAEASLGDQVAVFIDLENLALGAGEDLPGQAEPIPYKALELLCRDYGNTSIRRAYADWSRPEFGRYQNSLAQNGITLIQVTRFGAQQKNAADILMAVDAMEVLITHPDVGTFLLVAGDGDYSPLVQRLREWGKWVVGVGTKASASSRLVAVCSEYKYWGTIVAAVNPAVRAEVGANFNIDDAKRLGEAVVSRGKQGGQVLAPPQDPRGFEGAEQQIGGGSRSRRQGPEPRRAHARRPEVGQALGQRPVGDVDQRARVGLPRLGPARGQPPQRREQVVAAAPAPGKDAERAGAEGPREHVDDRGQLL